jgi:hypothetical protein
MALPTRASGPNAVRSRQPAVVQVSPGADGHAVTGTKQSGTPSAEIDTVQNGSGAGTQMQK